jgi:hypothetical protein
LIGEIGYNIVGTDAGKRRRQVINRMIATKKPQYLEDKDKDRTWSTSFIPIMDEKSKFTMFMVIIKDVKDEKKKDIEKNEEF